MARINVAQTAFSAGELSPHLLDRIDLEAYLNGCSFLENFVPIPHGPIVRRRGTRFIYEAASANVRLIPFSFNINQSFVLEFTPGKIRVFYEDGIIVNSNGTIYEGTTPYRAEDIPNLNWAQFGDWLYVVDGYHKPAALKRYANNDWRYEELEFTDQPEEWGGTNWPKVVALFEQRAWYFATPNQPQQLWASRTGLYEEFTYEYLDPGDPDADPPVPPAEEPEVFDDHAITYTIFSNDVNGIQWAMPMSALIIGTSGAEFKASSSSSLDPITPKNFQVTTQTRYGSAAVRPIAIGTNVIFTQRSRNRIRSFEYSFAEDQYSAQDLTIYASHILEGKIKEMAVQTAPDNYILFVTEDGNLIGCTYEKQQRVLAWHRHSTQGKFISLAVLPTVGNDIIYVAVQRVINGVTRTYIEMMEDPWEATEDIVHSYYMDSRLTYEGTSSVTNISGLQHLNNTNVQVLCDGWIHRDLVVTNGQITLDEPAKVVSIGLPFISDYISVIPQGQDQLTVGLKRKFYRMIVAVEDSLDYFYKIIDDDTIAKEYINYEGPTKIMNQAKDLSSRHDSLQLNGGTSSVCRVHIWQPRQLPLIIRGIVFGLEVNDV